MFSPAFSLTLYVGCLLVFVSMYQVELISVPVLVELPYVVGVLCCSVTQAPWSPEPRSPGVYLLGVVLPSYCSWLLLTHKWEGLTHRLTGCGDWTHPQCINCCAMADSIEGDSLQGLLMPTNTTLHVCP